MIKAVVFDAFGTLFDVHSVIEACEARFPGQGRAISQLWRQTQLEYTWLRTIMERYADYEAVMRDALRYTLNTLGLPYDDTVFGELFDAYFHLKPFPEVEEACEYLLPRRMAILSNSSDRLLHKVVNNAGLKRFFTAALSVDVLKKYKPSPDVYQMAASHLGVPKEQVLFVSTNGWDVAGAKSFGFKVCWINRTGMQPDELGVPADFEVRDLIELAEQL
jgi:2-haloacid dehalogenase